MLLKLVGIFAAFAGWRFAQPEAPPARTAEPAGKFPVRVELVKGELEAHIHLAQVPSQSGPVPCWVYVSQGLWAHKQKELVFALRRDPGEKPESFPHAPLDYFSTVLQLAKQGRLVEAGDYIGFGGTGFLARGFNGLAYAAPQWLPEGVKPAPNLLAAILLTQDELEAVKEFGCTRVMTLLARSQRWFPAPVWSDRRRSSVLSMKQMQQSILAKVARVRTRGVRVHSEANRIRLRVETQAASRLLKSLEQLPEGGAAAVLTEIDPIANAAFVWEPGQRQIEVITGPGSDASRVAGSFLLFLPGLETNGGEAFEDGYAMRLTQPAWKRIRDALRAKAPVTLDADGKYLGFTLEWIEQGWETYAPAAGAAQRKPAGPLETKQITLLAPQEEIGQRIQVQDLAAFVRSVETTMREYFGSLPRGPAFELAVQCTILPGRKAEYKMLTRPEPEREILAGAHALLIKLPPPEIKGGRVPFQIEFAIWGGAGAAQPSPVP